MATQTHRHANVVPLSVMWMEIELIINSGLLVGLSHGLLP